MKSPDGNLKASELIIDYETKTLRDTRDILNKENCKLYNRIQNAIRKNCEKFE